MEMSTKARKEMVADWRGAGKAQGTPNTLAWYKKNYDKMKFANSTRDWVEKEIGFTE